VIEDVDEVAVLVREAVRTLHDRDAERGEDARDLGRPAGDETPRRRSCGEICAPGAKAKTCEYTCSV